MKKKFFIISIICSLILMNINFCFAGGDEDIKVWSPISNEDTSSNISENTLQNNTISTSTNTDISDTSLDETNETNEIFNTNSTLVNSTGLITNTSTVEDNPLKLTCGGAILIEQTSGNILYNHNMHEKLRPASVTKVMSLLLIMEALDSGRISLTDKVPCTEDAAKMGGSQIWLDTREELTVDEMLKAIAVVSANDYVVQY